MRTGLGRALELVRRKRWQVDSLHRMEQEEWLFGVAAHMISQELLTLLQEDKIDFFEIEVGGDQTGAVIAGINVLG